jgi:hypothetical protein
LVLPITEAWEAARRRRTGGGASAPCGGSVGIEEGRGRRVGGVGCFTRVGAALL